MLLERPGDVVPREELQKRLWPSDTFVDFDLSLNSAVMKLRNALEDDSDNPKFIETLYRRGYRFIAPVNGTQVEAVPNPVQAHRHALLPKKPTPRLSITARDLLIVVFIAAAVLISAAALVFRLRFSDAPKVTNYTQITHDGQVKGFQSFVTDGARLYTRESQLGHFVIAEVAAGGGDTAILPVPFTGVGIDDITSDGSALLVRATEDTRNETSVWKLPLPTGSPTRVGNLVVHWTAWSPVTGSLVFSRDKGIFVANSDGSNPRKVVTTDGLGEDLRFSPNGGKLRFTLVKDGFSSLWELNPDGSGLHPLLAQWHGASQECCGNWTPDGKYFLFQSLRADRNDIWALPERRHRLGDAEPVQITNGPLDFTLPLPSRDGKKIFTVGLQRRAELVRYDAKTGFAPYLGGMSAEGLTFSSDGQWIAYVSVPDGALWRSRMDGSERIKLTRGSMRVALPRWSPDGEQILFVGRTSSTGPRAYLVAAKGGIPQELIPGADFGSDPVWSPDGKSILVSLHDAFRHSSGISVLDLKTLSVSDLPGSANLFSQRCSPDGRFIAAITTDSRSLMLFDRSTAQWTQLVHRANTLVAYPSWSHDGRYVYFDGVVPEDPALFRVRVSDRKLEQVLSLKGVRQYWGEAFEWSGLAPDDSFLLVRDVSSQEIYALDWQAP